jgi:tRNA pseudouridine38-40 synthase
MVMAGCKRFGSMKRNLKLTVAYDGADFSGWQVQPGRATVQGSLAAGLLRITGERVLPQGSGRTDAGVHALGQVASVAIASPIPPAQLAMALNHILPRAIRVLRVEEAPPEFHARTSAQAKTYRYRIYRASVCPPFLARYVYHHPWPLDETAMAEAAGLVVGAHDFTSFAALDPERSLRENASAGSRESGADLPSSVRIIFRSSLCRQDDELTYEVRGSGFLHHMVRNLVGTFLLVGKGTLRPENIPAIMAAGKRSANPGATAPASGLYLVEVEY